MGKENDFALEVVSVRLVRDAPILSETKIRTSEDVIHLVGEQLCGMDREVVCVINLKADNTPINCHFASVGSLNYSMAHPRELRWSSFFVTLTRKSFDIHHTCILFSNGVIYPFDECGRI